MENIENGILTDQAVGKEYQIPELVDLNSIRETMGDAGCTPGSAASGCSVGSGDGYG